MLSEALHWLGYGLCHQLPARSLASGGYQLPVCARDTGIYVGFMVAVAVIALLDRGRHRTGMPPAWLLGVGFAAVALLGWDGLTSYLGLRPTTNLLRLATGIGTGFALSLVVVPLLNTQLWKRRLQERVLAGALEGLAWCAAAPVTFAAVWWGGPLLGVAYPLVVSAAILMTFTAVNLVLVSLASPFERAFSRFRDMWLAVLLALGLTLLEIAMADGLRMALVSLVSRF
jgi:uncharacterized membrane protein